MLFPFPHFIRFGRTKNISTRVIFHTFSHHFTHALVQSECQNSKTTRGIREKYSVWKCALYRPDQPSSKSVSVRCDFQGNFFAWKPSTVLTNCIQTTFTTQKDDSESKEPNCIFWFPCSPHTFGSGEFRNSKRIPEFVQPSTVVTSYSKSPRPMISDFSTGQNSHAFPGFQNIFSIYYYVILIHDGRLPGTNHPNMEDFASQ